MKIRATNFSGREILESERTTCSPKSFHVLVTDCNHHVGNLLQRELEKEGYTVYLPKSGNSAFAYLCSSARIDLIILDPQLFYPCDKVLISRILRHHPDMRIIIHSYKDILRTLQADQSIRRIEKNAESIGSLKNCVQSFFLEFSDKQLRVKV